MRTRRRCAPAAECPTARTCTAPSATRGSRGPRATVGSNTGIYDLGVAMAAASCIHPSHREFGVTSGRPRVVGFFDCVAHAEVMQVQGPFCSISAFDRGDDYDEYAVCIA